MHIKTTLAAALVAAFLLPACGSTPAGQAFKSAVPVIADKVADGAYRVTCGLPYRTEKRFLARNDIDVTAHLMFCKRTVP